MYTADILLLVRPEHLRMSVDACRWTAAEAGGDGVSEEDAGAKISHPHISVNESK